MAIDEQAIIAACSQLPLVGNEDGLIPAFGLYLTRHYADFYNQSSFMAVYHASQRSHEALLTTETALVEAGMTCGFYTFGGIMLSQEWEAVVQPMIESEEDWVYGIVAIINTLGWGKWRVEHLIPGQRLDVSIENSYESQGWLDQYSKSERPRCYLVQGGCASIMNLLYQGNIRESPALTPESFQTMFHSEESFRCQEVTCRTMGDPVCRFVTTRMGGAS